MKWASKVDGKTLPQLVLQLCDPLWQCHTNKISLVTPLLLKKKMTTKSRENTLERDCWPKVLTSWDPAWRNHNKNRLRFFCGQIIIQEEKETTCVFLSGASAFCLQRLVFCTHTDTPRWWGNDWISLRYNSTVSSRKQQPRQKELSVCCVVCAVLCILIPLMNGLGDVPSHAMWREREPPLLCWRTSSFNQRKSQPEFAWCDFFCGTEIELTGGYLVKKNVSDYLYDLTVGVLMARVVVVVVAHDSPSNYSSRPPSSPRSTFAVVKTRPRNGFHP